VTDRDWEDDTQVASDGCNTDDIDDIAEQLLRGKTGSRLKVMLGGGSRHFVSPPTTEHGTVGRRSDGKNLIDEWVALNPTGKFVRNRDELLNVSASVDKLLGLFHGDHIPYHIDIVRDHLEAEKPSLADMTRKAIEILDTDSEGYFLFVEGGRIDHGHHRTRAKHALSENVEFSKAIEVAAGLVDLDETLIVVTADHGHVMTLGGYAVSKISMMNH
jgi:alkaline phosphatase